LKQVCACRMKHPRDPRMNLRPTVVTSCSGIFRRVGKRTWLVSKPFRATYGRDHVVLFGTNLRHEKAVVALPGRPEIYRCDSPEGRAVIADIDRFSGEAA